MIRSGYAGFGPPYPSTDAIWFYYYYYYIYFLLEVQMPSCMDIFQVTLPRHQLYLHPSLFTLTISNLPTVVCTKKQEEKKGQKEKKTLISPSQYLNPIQNQPPSPRLLLLGGRIHTREEEFLHQWQWLPSAHPHLPYHPSSLDCAACALNSTTLLPLTFYSSARSIPTSGFQAVQGPAEEL